MALVVLFYALLIGTLSVYLAVPDDLPGRLSKAWGRWLLAAQT